VAKILACVVLLLTLALSSLAGGIQGTAVGDTHCNCLTTDVKGVPLTHESYVTVFIPNDGSGNSAWTDDQPTGKTQGSPAATVDVPAGQCVYISYSFTCCQDEEDEWICEMYQVATKSRAVVTGDC